LPREVGQGADGVEVLALEQAQGILIGNALATDHFVVEVAQAALLQKEVHAVSHQ
jgi:hypothetical protein